MRLPLGRICFVPGDKDWANLGRDGLKAVRRLEKYIEKQLPGQNAFVPTGGCPGPEVVDVAPLVRPVALNTHSARPAAPVSAARFRLARTLPAGLRRPARHPRRPANRP